MSLPMAPQSSPCAKHGCAACCYDTEMPLTEEDIARLVKLGHARDAFVRIAPGEGWPILQTKEKTSDAMPGKPCFFLVEDKCSVYADRPQGCRIYPLVMNEQGRMLRDEDCPHRGEFAMDPSAKRRIQKIAATLQREARAR